jgi:hypothetical protein
MGRKFKPSTRLTAVIIAILLRVLNSALAICGVIRPKDLKEILYLD